MLRELWKLISNLGISDRLTPIDEKAIKLINQISFVMMIWFALFSIEPLVNWEPIGILLTTSNVFLFGAALFLNYHHKTTTVKNYFMIYGLVMITFVNIVLSKEIYPMVQFIVTAIFPVLIFRKRSVAFVYFCINILLSLFVFLYHMNYPPLLEERYDAFTGGGYLFILIIMTVVFLISLFFRNVGDDLEHKLVEKNRYLNELIEKTKSMQEQMISSEKMASLGQLTAGIAHEINNPINFVSSNINPLKTDLSELKELCSMYKKLHNSVDLEKDLKSIETFAKEIDPEFLYDEIETLTNGIEEGAERTKKIVLGLRSFSRIDEEEFKTIDLHEGIESTLMLLRNKIKNRIEIIKDYGELPPVECMPGKINQVIMNILNNASEAIRDKGKITIRTLFEKRSGQVNILIRDSGSGMKESVRRRIFEPFYTTKEIGKGTGLGLSISYGIIEKHHGNITVLSKENEGSEFKITLPVKQPKS